MVPFHSSSDGKTGGMKLLSCSFVGKTDAWVKNKPLTTPVNVDDFIEEGIYVYTAVFFMFLQAKKGCFFSLQPSLGWLI